MEFFHLSGLTRGVFYAKRPAVTAATPWGFSLLMDRDMVAHLRQCCEKLQEGMWCNPQGKFRERELTCLSCNAPACPLQDNRHMVLWTLLEEAHVEQWLLESRKVSPLEVPFLADELLSDFNRWLASRRTYPRWCMLESRRAEDLGLKQ